MYFRCIWMSLLELGLGWMDPEVSLPTSVSLWFSFSPLESNSVSVLSLTPPFPARAPQNCGVFVRSLSQQFQSKKVCFFFPFVSFLETFHQLRISIVKKKILSFVSE